jgi:hypothetical protein
MVGDTENVARGAHSYDKRVAGRKTKIWQCILEFALVLWIVRVPLTTTALGLLLLGYTPQAQDLFVEFADASFLWMLYFLFVLIAAWAMPTHYAARLLLDTDERFNKLLSTEQQARQKRTEGAPLTADESKCALCLKASAAWVPRLLGLLTFVAALIAIWRSHLNLPDLDQKEVIASVNLALSEVALLVVAGGAGFLLYTVKRPRNADLRILSPLKLLNRVLAPLWRRFSPGLADPSGSDEEASRDVGRLLLLAIFLIFVFVFTYGADAAAQVFPRAMAVPFILGGWLPLLSYLAGLARQWRAPLIVIFFGVISSLAVLLGDNHSVRRIVAASTSGHAVNIRKMRLETAVALWMRENGCADTPGSCPRPIIISAAGGASRAGFFMASIIGYFLQEAPTHGLNANMVRNRLFAISSVSGGSMGAVMVTAALDAKRDSSDHPCVQTPVDLWWGQSVNNWRDCFEALTSGDFLTADFLGFAFNDMVPLGPWRDRAAVLEDSWSRRYREVVTRADKPDVPSTCEGLDCPFLTLRPRPAHWIPLLVLNGSSEATGGRIVTTPLDSTYTPAVKCPTADVSTSTACPLFVQSDRFHDLLSMTAQSDAWFGWVGEFERYLLRNASGDDIRLSTAALNSARFPLISPPGTVRSNIDEGIIDRIVDGGYFESYGALSAKELALAVHAIEPKLAPVVIVISNDPNDVLATNDDSPNAKGQLQAPAQQELQDARAAVNATEWLTDITAPLTTSINARTAHGTLGVAELHSVLHAAIPGCDELLIQVRVWPQNGKGLSMSWWESNPVQRQLHRQTEDGKDANQNGPHLQAIWDLMKTTSACAGAG